MSRVLFEHTHPGESLPSIALIESLGCLSVVVRGSAPFANLSGSNAAVLLADETLTKFAIALNGELAQRHRQNKLLKFKPKALA